MDIDSECTRRVIKAIAARMTRDPALRDDLFQEALIRLWSMQRRRPGQSDSWYLQGCKFHLLNCINKGRSVDSPRHVSKRVSCTFSDIPYASERNEDIVEQRETETSLESDICARDNIAVLKGQVNSLEKEIVIYLVQGFGIREIARRIGVSHVCVLNHRSNIAKVAISLGICLARQSCLKSSKAV